MNEALEFIKETGMKVRSHDIANDELSAWMGESVLDPIQKDLSSEIWNSAGNLKKDVRAFIINTFDKWQKQIKKEFEIEDITLLGSIATYQYSDTSDIDIHIHTKSLTDKEKNDLRPTLPKIDLPKTKHRIEYFFPIDKRDVEMSDVAYDVLNDKWLKKPQKTDVKIPIDYIIEIAKFFIAGIEDRAAQYERDKVELELYKSYLADKEMNQDKEKLEQAIEKKQSDILADLDALHVAQHMAKAFRHEAYQQDGYEYDFTFEIKTKNPNLSINNLVDKLLDKFGYHDRLRKYAEIREKLQKKS